MTSLTELLDLLDLAAARADGVVPREMTDAHGSIARRIRTRSGFVGDALIVAVAGGTGCGKSSIVNALVGEPVASTGIVRPTTERALAVMSPTPHVDLDPLLDLLEVSERVSHPGLGPLVLVDLPDFDSTRRHHRRVVEEMLPRVDAVIWVLDPEKYADPVLHDGFLSGVAGHSSRFVFALNQSDRLGDRVEDVVASLRSVLVGDGLGASPVIPTVAEPRVGIDVAGLTDELERRWDVKATALRAVAWEMRRVASDGWLAAGEGVASDSDREAAALARASFVSLGVAAYELHHRFEADDS